MLTKYVTILLTTLTGLALIFVASLKSFPITPIFTQPSNQIEGNPKIVHSKPVKLYIPKISKILEISDGQIKNNRWTIAKTGVSFLTTSALPGTVGNSVIYGHNKKDILGVLPKVDINDPIYVVLENGEFIEYKVYETKEISPSQVEILNNSPDSRLTIYTCSGFLDQARFVVVASKAQSLSGI